MFGEHYQNIWFQQDGAPPHYGIDSLKKNEDAQNESPASLRHQRHPDYKKYCNLGEVVFSLSHQVHSLPLETCDENVEFSSSSPSSELFTWF
ncbi:hypothetical protein J6590_077830 [Homalodisca vitripennis]|nr:hypothetical protein J6590_077830 [Homalodisca vitripennis]